MKARSIHHLQSLLRAYYTRATTSSRRRRLANNRITLKTSVADGDTIAINISCYPMIIFTAKASAFICHPLAHVRRAFLLRSANKTSSNSTQLYAVIKCASLYARAKFTCITYVSKSCRTQQSARPLGTVLDDKRRRMRS